MDKTAIEKIVSLAEPNISEHYGFSYSDKPIEVIEAPTVETVNFKTLAGLTKILNTECERFRLPIIVSIIHHNEVRVISAINKADRTREYPYSAIAETPSFQFDRFMSYEEMMIALKSKFVETQSLLDLVQLLGSIVQENTATASDDGFSQSVVVKKGIALKDNRVINPIVRLTPYRTFLDVEQPESDFLIRLQDGGRVALYEADGGAWKLVARKNIADHLTKALGDLVKDKKVFIVE